MQIMKSIPFLSFLVVSCTAFVVRSPSNGVHQGMSMLASTTVDVKETTPAASTANVSSPKSYLDKGDLDTETLLAKSTFAIKPDELIEVAKDFIFIKKNGIADKGASLSDDFVFRAAFVEVLDKDKFVEALLGFNLEDSFELRSQYFGWTVDPTQSNRVWVYNRQEGIHTNDFVGVKPTGNKLVLPPQSIHMDFNEEGKCTEFGVYTVDRGQGNTGGLGGVFAFFYGVGRPLPFPEGKPYKFSLQRRLVESIGNIARKFSKKK
jgi:hypothetical protein